MFSEQEEIEDDEAKSNEKFVWRYIRINRAKWRTGKIGENQEYDHRDIEYLALIDT